VSVIVPSYNYVLHLREAIESVLAASRADSSLAVEIILFDDCSSDGSYEVALEVAREAEIPIIVAKPRWNVGLSRARNLCTHFARGKYVFMLDADNTVNPEGLSVLHRFAETREADAVYGPIRIVLPDGSVDGFISNISFDPEKLRNSGNYIDAMALIRKSSLIELGGYSVDLLRTIGGWEDYDLWLRMAERARKVVLCNEIVVGNYLRKRGSMVQRISLREKVDAFRSFGSTISIGSTRGTTGLDRLVFDLGFHKGEDTAYYLDSGFSVVAVEADHSLYECGLCRFEKQIQTGRLILIHAVVVGWEQGLSKDEIEYHPHSTNSVWGSADERFVRRNAEHFRMPHDPAVMVRTTTLEKLVEQFGVPYFLKIDIEGLDSAVVADIERLPAFPAFVSWETGKRNLIETLRLHLMLWMLGYDRFRVMQQCYNHEKTYQPRASSESKKFEPASSGPMPDRCRQHWHGLLYSANAHLCLSLIYRIIGPYSVWSWAERSLPRQVADMLKSVRSDLSGRSIPFPGWFDAHAALSERSKSGQRLFAPENGMHAR
jgi:FkbM family methyltransferase